MAETQYSKEMSEKDQRPLEAAQTLEIHDLENPTKGRWERSWPTIACGAGLFSDGYLNQVCIFRSPGSRVQNAQVPK